MRDHSKTIQKVQQVYIMESFQHDMTDITQAPEQWLSASQSNSAWEASNARSPSKKVLPGDPNPGFWQWSSRSLMPSHVLQWFYMVAATSCILPKDPRFSSFLLFFWSRVSSLDWRCSIRGTVFAPSKSCPIHQNSCFILSVQFLGPHFWRLNLSSFAHCPQRKPCISSPLVPKCGCRKCCWDPASAEDLRWCVPSVAEWAEPGWDHPWLSGPQQRFFFSKTSDPLIPKKGPTTLIGRDFHPGHLLTYWQVISSPLCFQGFDGLPEQGRVFSLLWKNNASFCGETISSKVAQGAPAK